MANRLTKGSSDEPENESKKKIRKVPTAHVVGFVDFIRQHAVVGLAVGIVLGTQVKGLVDQLDASFITPIVSAVIGDGKSYTAREIVWRVDHKVLVFAWGSFLYALIDFIAIVAALYAIIKIFKLDKLDKPIG